MNESVPVTVVIPTLGRPRPLERCLASIVACRPTAAEILVVDQSHSSDVRSVIERFADRAVRLVPDQGSGEARATNLGLVTAKHDVVLRTDDDCVVAPDWVEVAWEQMLDHPGGIVTGRVLAWGDPETTVSTKDQEEPHDYTGEKPTFVLYTGNMAVDRREAIRIGLFDERNSLSVVADNEFCYRWMDLGLPLRYEPALTVWHDDQRDRRNTRRRFWTYALGQGAFYGKHLYEGDLRLLRYVVRDLIDGARGIAGGILKRRLGTPDARRARLFGIPIGLVIGLLEARSLSRAQSKTPPLSIEECTRLMQGDPNVSETGPYSYTESQD